MADKEIQRPDNSLRENASREDRLRERSRESSRDSETTRFLVPMSAMLAGRRWRLTARAIGLAFFIAGAALLVWVFIEAVRGFARLGAPNYFQEQVNRIGGTGPLEAAIAAFSVIGGEIMRLLYLLLLGLLGSLIAGKGIAFFAASESVIDEAVVGIDEEI
ncbi:MAG TPA: hypothetical protein VF681_07250 [Abditibacteriaceae bacterium]|jgi:hypothetical protein